MEGWEGPKVASRTSCTTWWQYKGGHGQYSGGYSSAGGSWLPRAGEAPGDWGALGAAFRLQTHHEPDCGRLLPAEPAARATLSKGANVLMRPLPAHLEDGGGVSKASLGSVAGRKVVACAQAGWKGSQISMHHGHMAAGSG